MQGYIVRRLLLLIPSALIVSLVTFALVRLMPGDAVLSQLAQAPSFRQEDVDVLRDKLGLNDPLWIQYARWLAGAIRGDLGRSLWSNQKTAELIAQRIPATLELAALSFIISTLLALITGTTSAVYQDSAVDYAIRLCSVIGLSVPGFWLGTLLIVLGSRWLGYLPSLQYIPIDDDPLGNLTQFLPPAAVLSVGTAAVLGRMVRSSLIEVLRQDFVRTAKAKGICERSVVLRHALPNALLPVVTLMGLQLSTLLSGSVVIETIFNLPGVGSLTYTAVATRDYTQIQANILVFALLSMMITLLIDVSYVIIDPRIRY